MMNVSERYWETYSDQGEDDGFTLIGVGENIEDIVDLEAQVKELQRRYGSKCEIKLYK